jgi:hypothetical protein
MEDWKKDLSDFFNATKEKKHQNELKLKQKTAEVASFYSSKAVPALEELKAELEKHGRQVTIHTSKEYPSITVKFEGAEEYSYAIKVRVSPDRAVPYPETRFTDKKDGRTYTSEGVMRSGLQDYDVSDICKDDIIRNFLVEYKLHVSGII